MELNVSNGYVVYRRGGVSKSTYWKGVHHRAVEDVEKFRSFYSREHPIEKYKKAGGRLVQLGLQEQKKEMSLINQTLGLAAVESSTEVVEFIRKFNEVLMGERQFKAALMRIQSALTHEKQHPSFGAPTVATWFVGDLVHAAEIEIKKFQLRTKNMIDMEEINEELEKMIDDIMENAIKNMLKKVQTPNKNNDLYVAFSGDRGEWSDLLEHLPKFSQDFKEMIRPRYNLDELKITLQKQVLGIGEITQKMIREILFNSGNDRNAFITGSGELNTKRQRGLSGFVQEFVVTMLGELGAASKKFDGIHWVLPTHKTKIDTVRLYNTGKPKNIQKSSIEFQVEEFSDFVANIRDELNKSLSKANSLNQAAQEMEKYYDDNLSKLEDLFIVYGSTKSRTLAKGFDNPSYGGFSGGGARKLQDAVSILTKGGMDKDVVQKMVNSAYNVSNEAILSHERMEIEEDFKTALMSNIAQLLFDDWVSIGYDEKQKAGAKAIHSLQLEGLEVPLSVFLIAIGKAMLEAAESLDSANQRASGLAKINIRLMNKTLYGAPDYIIDVSKTDQPRKVILEKWEEQRKVARKESTFTVQFLIKFKTIVADWIKRLA